MYTYILLKKWRIYVTIVYLLLYVNLHTQSLLILF